MISIVIPTLNEERCLPTLLSCVKGQIYKDYEIIVADANSKDRTRQIAKKFGCRLVKSGGLPGIGRNNGAKAAKGDILLFLDADSQLDNDFLKNCIEQIKKRKLDVGGCYLKPLSSKLVDKMFMAIFNAWTSATQYFYPNACGTGIFCKKWLHEKVKGFDETIRLSEDMDYVRRCGKYGKFRILSNPKVLYSMRRYEKEGRFNVGLKLFLSAVYRLVFGEIRSDIFRYSLKYKK